jgi:hypothetical protein
MTVMVSWLCSVGLGCFCGFDEVDVGVWLGQVACAALGKSFVKNYGSTPTTS